METSTSRPQEQTGMPPEQAFWKALVMVGITSLVAWSAIWIFVGFRTSFQGDEWLIGSILLLFTVLFLAPVVYYNYRRGPTARKNSRRTNILLGICCACLSVGHFLDVVQRPTGHDLWINLVSPFAWLLLAGLYFHRASKLKGTASLPS